MSASLCKFELEPLRETLRGDDDLFRRERRTQRRAERFAGEPLRQIFQPVAFVEDEAHVGKFI